MTMDGRRPVFIDTSVLVYANLAQSSLHPINTADFARYTAYISVLPREET